jgi:hypothetical protein
MDAQDLLREALEHEAAAQRALLDGDEAAAAEGFARAAECYRRSWEAAGPTAYGRLIGMLKATILGGGDTVAAARYAQDVLDDPTSAAAWYVLGIAAAIKGERAVVRNAADGMMAGGEAFQRAAAALRAIADRDAAALAAAVQAIKDDFAARERHLTGVAIADTALMFERLAPPVP